MRARIFQPAKTAMSSAPAVTARISQRVGVVRGRTDAYDVDLAVTP